MGTIALYTNPMSRGQIARWALHEAGADYEEHLLNYGQDMNSETYLAINPMGKVPTIVHDDIIVTECAAICLYLAQAFPEADLMPHTPAEQADYLRWSFFGAGPLEQAIVNHSMGWGDGADPQVQGRLGYGSYERTMNTLSGLFQNRDYVCGKRFTAADIYLGAQVDWGLQFKTITETPALTAYAERLRTREAYKSAKAVDAAHIEESQSKG